MANQRRAGNLSLLLLLTATTGVLGACTLLLSKEPLTCATNSDCAKYPGTTCDLQALECRAGGSVIDGPVAEGGADAPSDGPIPFEGGDPCTNPNKPVVELKGEITANMTLKCDSDYVLVGVVTVAAPFTLTIQPNTTIYGDATIDPATNGLGTLLIPSGAKIMAIGQADKPIIFTSGKKLGAKYAGDGGTIESGDWGGIYILGEAPVNTNAQGTSTKISFGAKGTFGGSKTNSDSGHLEYVRIEYGGSKLPDGADGAALDLAGVGDATVIDHVMSRFSLNDCVEIIGGRAQLKHFLCQYPSDDGIAWEAGWTGKAQFVIVQGRPNINDGANGMQGRSGAVTALPQSEPSIYNATFIGQNRIPDETLPLGRTLQYGLRLEKFSRAHIMNSAFVGWSDSAIDLRGSNIAADVAAGGTEIKSCVAYGNLGDGTPSNNVAFIENQPAGGEATDPTADDDNGFDELAWWKTPAFNNTDTDPGITKPFDPGGPVFHAGGSINAGTAAQPPNDGFFDPTAKYVGALKDSSDLWATGKWVRWSGQ